MKFRAAASFRSESIKVINQMRLDVIYLDADGCWYRSARKQKGSIACYVSHNILMKNDGLTFKMFNIMRVIVQFGEQKKEDFLEWSLLSTEVL